MGSLHRVVVALLLVAVTAAAGITLISGHPHPQRPRNLALIGNPPAGVSVPTVAALPQLRRVQAPPPQAARLAQTRRSLAVLVRLPVSSQWALPPLVMISTQTPAPPTTTRRLLADSGIAIAPSVRANLAAGADPRALASLLTVATPQGPILVLHLSGNTATLQATSLAGTRTLVAGLIGLPHARRPRLLLIPAPGDAADLQGPPRPQPGQLASLVPIYQLAGARHGVDWRVLAAINVVETNLGTNMHVSSAGAVGWMQFMPATWLQYGVDANGDGVADPYNPYDAIETAAIYLEAAGARTDLARAIFAYNHAQWYVNEVLNIAAHLPATFTSQTH